LALTIALSHIKDGTNNTQTARNLHISRRIVNDWVRKFHEQGFDDLKMLTYGSKTKLALTSRIRLLRT